MLDLFIEVAEVIDLRLGIGRFSRDHLDEFVKLVGLHRIAYLLMGIAKFVDERFAVGGQIVQLMPLGRNDQNVALGRSPSLIEIAPLLAVLSQPVGLVGPRVIVGIVRLAVFKSFADVAEHFRWTERLWNGAAQNEFLNEFAPGDRGIAPVGFQQYFVRSDDLLSAVAEPHQQAIGDLNAERKQQSANLENDRAADTQNWAGGKIIKGSEWLGGAVRTGLSDSQTGRQTLQGRVAGSIIELGGGAYGLYQQYQSIQNRADGKQRSLTQAFDTRIANQEGASRSLVQNQEMYLGEIVGANQRRALGLTAAEVAGANRAVAGANSGAAVAKGGVNQGYHLDLQANWITYDRAVKAASRVRDASFEAARLRALSTVVSAVGHNVARDMEQGLALRY